MDKLVTVTEVNLTLRSRIFGAGELHPMGKDLSMVPPISCFMTARAKLLILVLLLPPLECVSTQKSCSVWLSPFHSRQTDLDIVMRMCGGQSRGLTILVEGDRDASNRNIKLASVLTSLFSDMDPKFSASLESR
jgi:hypothetical protein